MKMCSNFNTHKKYFIKNPSHRFPGLFKFDVLKFHEHNIICFGCSILQSSMLSKCECVALFAQWWIVFKFF